MNEKIRSEVEWLNRASWAGVPSPLAAHLGSLLGHVEELLGKRQSDLYFVQRENLDGLHVFESEAKRDEYAALFDGEPNGSDWLDVGTITVLDDAAADKLIRDERESEDRPCTRSKCAISIAAMR